MDWVTKPLAIKVQLFVKTFKIILCKENNIYVHTPYFSWCFDGVFIHSD